jgi:hypothetical protein
VSVLFQLFFLDCAAIAESVANAVVIDSEKRVVLMVGEEELEDQGEQRSKRRAASRAASTIRPSVINHQNFPPMLKAIHAPLSTTEDSVQFVSVILTFLFFTTAPTSVAGRRCLGGNSPSDRKTARIQESLPTRPHDLRPRYVFCDSGIHCLDLTSRERIFCESIRVDLEEKKNCTTYYTGAQPKAFLRATQTVHITQTVKVTTRRKT